jgi:flavin-dependent dehydrogenase
MIRPFKGKGINSAIITGIIAADTAVRFGISRRAFRRYEKQCAFITRDYPYGRLVRLTAKLISKKLSLAPVIRFAKKNERFRWALTKSVSGGATYREIVHCCLRPGIALGLLAVFISAPFKRGADTP